MHVNFYLKFHNRILPFESSKPSGGKTFDLKKVLDFRNFVEMIFLDLQNLDMIINTILELCDRISVHAGFDWSANTGWNAIYNLFQLSKDF